MGISLGDQQPDSSSSNLRFADDVLLFSTSMNQLKKMISDFKRSTEKVGLKIHPDKTKIFDKQRSSRQSEATIDDISVEIQPLSGKAQYLGHHFVRATRHGRSKEQNPRCLGIICQM